MLDAGRLSTAISNALNTLESKSVAGTKFGATDFADAIAKAVVAEIAMATVTVTGTVDGKPFTQLTGTLT